MSNKTTDRGHDPTRLRIGSSLKRDRNFKKYKNKKKKNKLLFYV